MMNVFSGKYSWDGKKHGKEDPIAWFPGAYNLKIFDLASDKKGVMYLKPFLCVYSKTEKGHSISENPEKFAKRICSEFSLEIDRVLWAEELDDNSGEFEVVVFTISGRLGDRYFYSIDKRQPLEGEKKIIEKALTGIQ